MRSISPFNSWIGIGVFIVYVITVGAAPVMSPEKLEKYVKKKYSEMHRSLESNQSLLGPREQGFSRNIHH